MSGPLPSSLVLFVSHSVPFFGGARPWFDVQFPAPTAAAATWKSAGAGTDLGVRLKKSCGAKFGFSPRYIPRSITELFKKVTLFFDANPSTTWSPRTKYKRYKFENRRCGKSGKNSVGAACPTPSD
jgi:hypothetical protein